MQIPSFLLQLLGHMLVYLLFKERFFIVYARLSFWAASWTKSWDQKHRKSKLQVVGPPPCGSQAGRAWWEFSVSGAAVCAGPGSRFWGSFWGLFMGPFLGPVLGRFSGLVNSGLIGGAKFDSKTGPKVDPKSDPKIGPVSGPVPAQTAGSSWIFRLVSRAGGRKRPAKPARILRRTWDLKRRFFHFRGLVLGPSARPRAGPGSTLFVTVLPLSASTPAGGPEGFLVQAI